MKQHHDPPLTNAEMQSVIFAAKTAVLKCLRQRKVKARAQKPASQPG